MAPSNACYSSVCTLHVICSFSIAAYTLDAQTAMITLGLIVHMHRALKPDIPTIKTLKIAKTAHSCVVYPTTLRIRRRITHWLLQCAATQRFAMSTQSKTCLKELVWLPLLCFASICFAGLVRSHSLTKRSVVSLKDGVTCFNQECVP